MISRVVVVAVIVAYGAGAVWLSDTMASVFFCQFHAQVIPYSNRLNYELIDVLLELSNIPISTAALTQGV